MNEQPTTGSNAAFEEHTLHHETQTKMYALMGSFADERVISNQHELVTAFHEFVTSGKFETSAQMPTKRSAHGSKVPVTPPSYAYAAAAPSSCAATVRGSMYRRGGRRVAL